MVTGRWRIHFSNRAFRAGLIPVCGVAAWLQGSQAVAVPAPPAAGRPPHQASADAPAGGPPETFHPGVPLAGSAIGPTGPTGFATAYATSYSCAFEFQPCDLAEFSGVSCATASSCSAVGTALGTTSLAEGWDGKQWTIEPTPPPNGSTSSNLASVSCTASTVCLAVGSYYGSGERLPLAESWDGSNWTIRPPPAPPGASNSELTYVQCASSSACMAVGSYYSGATNEYEPLVESWDGSSWTIETAPLPAEAEGGELYGVSCPGESACTAVGSYYSATTGQTPLAEAWNGTSWATQSVAVPIGSTGSALKAVWCESAKSCKAVGVSATGTGENVTLAESWDGTNWTIETTPNPIGQRYDGLANLSCAPVGEPCTAVGFSEGATLTEHWDGMNWTIQSTPSPPNSSQSSFADVSCRAASACTAVGRYLDLSEGPTGGYVTLAERWDGMNWTIQPTANPALAETTAATGITATSATLNGTVYPGGDPTTCYFEYGPTSAYGATVPCTQSAGAGTAPVAVSANLTGLSPNSTYHVSLVATNAGGGTVPYTASDASFTTPVAPLPPSPGGSPPGTTSTCASGSQTPRSVVILITGIASSLPLSGSYDPAAQDYCGLAQYGLLSSLTSPLADLVHMAQTTYDTTLNGAITPTNFTDALAATGAVLLPYSYTGAQLTGTRTHPVYSVNAFGEEAPGSASPEAQADSYLLTLIREAHAMWPTTPIYVIGHSEGGLVAEQLFERHSLAELQGVARIVSLDSPINGVLHTLAPWLQGVTHISPKLFDIWTARWYEREGLDARLVVRDAHMGDIFLPIGTPADPVYELGDLTFSSNNCLGLYSQLFFLLSQCGSNSQQPIVQGPPWWLTAEPARHGTPHWPYENVSGALNQFFAGHEFVMKSAENIAYVAGLVSGNTVATAARAHVIGTLPLAKVASTTVPGAARYAPAASARLLQDATVPGATVQVQGSDLGSGTGGVTIVTSRGTVGLPVTQWTPKLVTVTIPPGTESGAIQLLTEEGQALWAGYLAVSPPTTRIASLKRIGRIHTVRNGEGAAFAVEALDANGRLVRDAPIQAIVGGETKRGTTNGDGAVVFSSDIEGCQPTMAFAGRASTAFTICLNTRALPRIRLTATHRRAYTLITAALKGHGPTRGQPIGFAAIAPPCAHISARNARTNSHGLVRIKLVSTCSTPVLVEASDGARSAGVLVSG